MEVLRDVEACRPGEGSIVTIGAYDGVHLGHQAVIGEVRRRAAAAELASVVVTFDRHPASVVRPESAPRLLTDLEQKLELLAGTGIDRCLVLTFDEARAHEPAEDFVHEVLVGALGTRAVIVGEDFHFGHQRRGNVAMLRREGEVLGFEVVGMDLVDEAGQVAGDRPRASSTAIRHALVAGDLGTAMAMLGRPYEVRGLVAQGDKRGRELGFPTANVSVPGEILLPADGIYAGWLQRADGTVLPAALSLGRRPTFYEEAHASLLEAHVLDFSGDLYDEHVRVRFTARLRGQVRFEDVDALVAQIAQDVEDTRAALR
ncbi:MAG TPA: bifunctional riboflavin kinase/FAD synthetase [Acidimicrobiales bacterium]|nr:bifunctional riboflavin kinase/FAD synthetase [Acidimicrobiales bacterium]